ncbi:hypothetical protein K1X76_06105 [bacterium]|nr:hypothetical protein [bacterium]
MISLEEQKEKITRGWLLLLFLNLLLFNSPAGDCGNDLAVGFPMVAGYRVHETGEFTLSSFALAIDLLTVIAMLLLFMRYIVSSFQINIKALKTTLIYFFTTNLICVVNYYIDKLLGNYPIKSHEFAKGLYQAFITPFVFFYIPGGYVGDFLYRHNDDQKHVVDILSTGTRVALIPTLILYYFLFSFLIWLFSKFRKSRNLPDTGPSL